MKGIAMALFAALVSLTTTITMSANDTDKDGHALVSLWESYNRLSAQDKPRDEAAALEKIKAQARARNLVWDWCDAARNLADTRARINWKDRTKAREDMLEEAREWGKPSAWIFLGDFSSTSEAEKYIKENAEALKSARNPYLYINDTGIGFNNIPEAKPRLDKLLDNDYEYALLTLDRSSGLVSEGFRDNGIIKTLLEYDALKSAQEREEFIKNRLGSPVCRLAEYDILEDEFRKLLDQEKEGTDFRPVDAKARTGISAIKEALKTAGGKDAVILDIALKRYEDLSRTLHSEVILPAVIEERNATIVVRNLSSVSVSIEKDGKTIWKGTASGSGNPLYGIRNLTFTIPELPDGTYTICAGTAGYGTEIVSSYSKYTLSIAAKSCGGSLRVYVADYKSGKPVDSCELILSDNGGKRVKTCSFTPEGFTAIPAAIKAAMKDGRYWSLQARIKEKDGSVRLSRELGLYRGIYERDVIKDSDTYVERDSEAVILCDRSAFNPGETVQYKVILYSGSYQLRTAAGGHSIKVTLVDPDGNEKASETLLTNEFGSAAGNFTIPSGGKGGNWRIRASWGNGRTTAKLILVDEFVLPSFNLSWEPADRLLLAGDTVSVRGRVQAYSGHMLSGATLKYKVTRRNETISSGTLIPDAHGDFSIGFLSRSKGGGWYNNHYTVTVDVTDSTGETLEFTTTRQVYPSLPVNFSISDADKGSFSLKTEEDVNAADGALLTSTPRPIVKAGFHEDFPWREDIELSWQLSSADGRELDSGSTRGQEIPLELPGAGLYRLGCKAAYTADDGTPYSSEYNVALLCVPYDCSTLPAGISSFFREVPGSRSALQVGTSCGPAWVMAELTGPDGAVLEKRPVYLEGEAGKEGSLSTVEFSIRPDYPEYMEMSLFWFKDSGYQSYTKHFEPDYESLSRLPLKFMRFVDTTLPGSTYSLTLLTDPGVEACISIFDAATESLRSNVWSARNPSNPANNVEYIPQMHIAAGCMRGGGYASYGIYKSGTMARSSAPMYANIAVVEDMVLVAEEDTAEAEYGDTMPAVRSDFRSTLAWEPFMRSGENGEIEFSFNTSDKLSTYYVQVFAHGKDFRNNTLRESMTVTIPVKVSAVQPQYLYSTDSYNAVASVYNSSAEDISGRMEIRFLDGSMADAPVISSGSSDITVPAGGTASFSTGIDSPAAGTLGILVSFIPSGTESSTAGDAVFVSVPVRHAVQTVREAHSALMRPGMDRNAIEQQLRSQFVNADGSAARMKEISIRRMLEEAVPGRITTDAIDVLKLCDALWADALMKDIPGADGGLSDADRARIISMVSDCHVSDGGFSWIAGMHSSPMITAAVLDKFTKMGDCLPEEFKAYISGAVKYLDAAFFSTDTRPVWRGGVSMEQYLNVRAHYAGVELNISGTDRKYIRDLKKSIGKYLAPAKEAGLSGRILAKARRTDTIDALLESAEGRQLAKGWGLGDADIKRMQRRLSGDVESLTQYAVEHVSGGLYFPNAVMPLRGLLDSELYAHSLLCGLMEKYGHSSIAEGVRLWIMVQKETQQWEDDPEYLSALSCVMKGTEETLGTSVMVLEGSTELAFADVKAHGNGFTIACKWYRDGKELAEGDTLHVGDRISSVYTIWNAENRSFVKVTTPRCAAFRPVNQVSGFYISPNGYRNVLADRTEYWFDVYPEETSTISEELFVTQEGSFSAPAPEVESLYAPHYRAGGICSAATVE